MNALARGMYTRVGEVLMLDRSTAPRAVFILALLLASASCRRERDDEDASVRPDASSGTDAALADAGAIDAGSPDAGTSAEDAAALLEAIDYAATIAALTAGPLVADAEMVDAMGDGASDASVRDRVETGVARDSIVTDGACVAFDWTARTAVITFTGCVSETSGLSIEGTVTLAVTYRPTTFAVTFDALAIGGTTIDGSLSLVVARSDPGTTFMVSAELTWTDGAGTNAVSLTDLDVRTDSGTGTTSVDGAFAVTVGATSAAGRLNGVTWVMGDCHPSSGNARFTIDGGRETIATFLPATPIDGTVRLEIPPFPATETMLLAPCE